MEERLDRVVSQPRESGSAEERMLRGDLVREIVARKERGEGVKRIARELGVNRKTVRRWLRLGAWQPRRPRPRRRLFHQLGAAYTDRQQEPNSRLLPPFAGPVQMRMSPAHVRPNGPPALHARIASMLDFPTLDEPCEGLANGEGRSRAQVPIALIVALAN